MHAAADALPRLSAINLVRKVSDYQALNQAVLIAQQTSRDQEFLNFKMLATQASSGNFQYNGLVVKKIGHSQCIVLPRDTIYLKDAVLNELHTSPLRGHLGYHKLLALVNAHFWWLHMPLAVQEF